VNDHAHSTLQSLKHTALASLTMATELDAQANKLEVRAANKRAAATLWHEQAHRLRDIANDYEEKHP